MIKHKYKCCLSENIEEVETEEEDNNDRQIVKQIPALETDDFSKKSNSSEIEISDKSNSIDSYNTTIPYNFKK